MKTFFQILKGFFYFFTIIVGLFCLRGDLFFSESVFNILRSCIMPLYLIITGLMIGYFIAHLQDKGDSNPKLYTKGFIVGVIIGLILALTYMFI